MDIKVEATEIKLIAHLQRDIRFCSTAVASLLFSISWIFRFINRVNACTVSTRRIKGLGADGEEGCIEGQRTVHLKPRDAEGHHYIGNGMGLGKQITNLGKGFDRHSPASLCWRMASSHPS